MTATVEWRRTRNNQPQLKVSAFGHESKPHGTFSDQCREALHTSEASLAAAGMSMDDVVRITFLVCNTDGFPGCYAMLRHAFGDARPAATLRLVGGFNRPDVKLELQLTAQRRS